MANRTSTDVRGRIWMTGAVTHGEGCRVEWRYAVSLSAGNGREPSEFLGTKQVIPLSEMGSV